MSHMGAGFIDYYHIRSKEAAEGFKLISGVLERHNIVACSRSDGKMYRATIWGEREPTERRDVEASIERGESGCVLYWHGNESVVSVTYESVGTEIQRQLVGLENVNVSECADIARAMVKGLCNSATPLLLVVDQCGESSAIVDWRRFVADETLSLPLQIPTALSPTVLGLKLERFLPSRSRFAAFDVKNNGDFVIASRLLWTGKDAPV